MNGVVGRTRPFPGTSTTWTLSGLPNGVHSFRVVATNAIGAGPSVTTAAIRIGVPLPPVGVVARAGRRQATVSWAAGADNGARIVRYVVTPHLDGVAQPSQALDARTRTRVLTGLEAGRSYTFTVRATNGRGTSEASAASPTIRPT